MATDVNSRSYAERIALTKAEQEVINRAMIWRSIKRMEKHVGSAPPGVESAALSKLEDAVDALDEERAQSVGAKETAEFIAAVHRLDESEIVKAVMSELGRRGGSSKSDAKKKAVRKSLAKARKVRWPSKEKKQ